jgi:CubicO group peptidase (beta-lactamase class C family)
MMAEPGKAFAYSNIGLNIVGRILEVIEKKDFESLFQQRIAIPLEMNQTTFQQKENAPNPSGSAESTSYNYMNFMQMILQNGMFKGKHILTEKAIAEMQKSETAGLPVLYTPGQGEGQEYALGEWVLAKDNLGNSTVVASPGLFGTYPYVDKKNNYAAIVMVKNLKTGNRKAVYSAIKAAIDNDISR